ncbi:carboxylating nicotinate-nucleotide diphosphorylase [Kaarinaea lacus]
MTLPPVLANSIVESVKQALQEDVGSGDLTAQFVDETTTANASIISRESAVFCGRPWASEVFSQLSDKITQNWKVQDGDEIQTGQIIGEFSGPSRPLLTGERTALNFLQTLSGTATRTRLYVNAIKGTHAEILDTRKTVPGLRLAQKYAVKCGGGHNHRIGLYDGILIKENHIEACGSLEKAIADALSVKGDILVEMEVETLDQLRNAIDAGVKRILLDNMDLETLREAVVIADKKAVLEASGGITLDNIRSIADTGVDYISVGDITKNINAIDLSMRFD